MNVPREAKYSHAGHYSLGPGFTRPSGKRHYPSSALVLNFLQSTKEKPSLRTHDDLRKLFHELGHAMHNLLSKTAFGRFHGTYVDGDFQEVPARMFENFVWNPTILSSMSCHYSYLSPEYLQAWQKEQSLENRLLSQPPKHPLEDLAKRLNDGKCINGAIYKMLQLHHTKFDIMAHSQTDRDRSEKELATLYDGMRHELSGLAGISAIDGKPSKAFSAFRAIVGINYDAGYYTYILADIFSLDLFYTGFKSDMLGPARGRKFRYRVLQPGGSRSEWETMTEYLGREPNTEAFYRELGWSV